MKNSTTPPHDEELLRLMLAGDGEAFERLYDRYQAGIYRFALRMSGSEAVAEDVTQDVFLTLMRDGGQYQARGSFAAYLFTIARHGVIRRLQRDRRFVALGEETEGGELPIQEQLVAEGDPLTELTRGELVDAVRQAIAALPVHYREVLLLCHLHEMSYAEAASVVGCEVGTVRSRLFRARAMVAERLGALKSDEPPQKKLNSARCFA